MRLVILLLCLLPSIAHAGSVTLTPSAWTGTVGEQVTVGVYADSEGALVNAVEAEIQYNPALLMPVAVSTAGSAFSLWATEPDVSIPGVVPLSGWAQSPQTGSLKVADIVFSVRAQGTHDVVVRSGALLAHDGKGSNVLTSLGRARLTAELATQAEGQVLGASTIEQPPLPPQFEVYGDVARDRLIIAGTAPAGSRVVFTRTSSDGTAEYRSDAHNGSFVIVGDRLDSGEYRISGETYLDGVVSQKSAETVLVVRDAPVQLAAAFLGAPSYVTILVGLLSFCTGFLIYKVFALLSARRR